jgi:hypothetical protein
VSVGTYRQHLSDSHNFGKRVDLDLQGRIKKPRSVFWEQLFLSASPFRHNIKSFFNNLDQADPLSCLPILRFYDVGPSSGSVQQLTVKPILKFSQEDAEACGAAMALLVFFGIHDLTVENVFIGLDPEGKFNFAPIDIECIGADLRLLSQSVLIPHKNIPERKCGIKNLLPAIRKNPGDLIAAICRGYLATLKVCSEKSVQLDRLMCNEVENFRPPIRIILRKTGSYVNYMAGTPKPKEFEFPALPSEIEQMGRGDVPYYFCYPDDLRIRHFVAEGQPEVSDADLKFPRRKILTQRNLISMSHRLGLETLSYASAFQIARGILTGGDKMAGSFKECTMTCDGEQIYLTFGTIKLKCALSNSKAATQI